MDILDKYGNVLLHVEAETLCGANLRGADLRGADLRGADLRGANLYCADLYGADLRGANLCGTNLYGADLRGADLRDANLYCADLRGANLRGANLYCADLRGANLRGAKYNENTAFFALACPEEGAFIGWKKVDNLLVKLLIPEDAQRSSATTRKCRASKAVVLEITGATGAPTLIVNHKYGHDTVYEVGKEVLPDSWDDNRWNECSHGIHFFITKQEAINY